MTEAEVLDRMIAKAQAEIGSLRARLELEERCLEDLFRRHQALLAAPQEGSGSRRTTARVHSDSLASHVLAILEAAGHEMDLTDIAQELERRVPCKRRKGGMRDTAYSAISRRNDLFVCLRRGVYDLTSRHPAILVERNGHRSTT